MPEIYVSTDVETDGPIPGPSSMLSFASAAFLADKTLLGTFSTNLETLPGAQGHPPTMNFWEQNADAYSATRSDLQGLLDLPLLQESPRIILECAECPVGLSEQFFKARMIQEIRQVVVRLAAAHIVEQPTA